MEAVWLEDSWNSEGQVGFHCRARVSLSSSGHVPKPCLARMPPPCDGHLVRGHCKSSAYDGLRNPKRLHERRP